MSSLQLNPGTLTKTKLLEFKDIMAACRTSGMGLLKLAYVNEHGWVVRFTMIEGQEDPVVLSAENTNDPGVNFRVYNFDSIHAFNKWVADAPSHVQLPRWNPAERSYNRVTTTLRRVETKDGRTLQITA